MTTIFSNNFIFVAVSSLILLFLAGIWYLVDHYIVRKYYHIGRRAAHPYVRLIPITSGVLNINNVQEFLDTVYRGALGGVVAPMEGRLSSLRSHIVSLEELIETRREEKNRRIVEMSGAPSDDIDDSRYTTMEENITVEIRLLDNQINTLKQKLAETTEIYIGESSKKGPEKVVKSSQILVKIKNKLQQLSSGFPPVMWFALFLVVVDYLIAYYFFNQLFVGKTKILLLDSLLAFIVPLAITLFCMVLAHFSQSTEEQEEAVGSGVSIEICRVTLASIFVIILLLRLLGPVSDGNVLEALTQLLLGILFMALVMVNTILIDQSKNNKTYQLLTTPVGLLLGAISMLFFGIIWFFEYLFIKGTPRKKLELEIYSQSNMQKLQNQIAGFIEEKRQKEINLSRLPQERTDFRKQIISEAQQDKMARLSPVINAIDNNVNEKLGELTGHKDEERKIQDCLSKIRNGSDDGALADLLKRKVGSPG